MKKIIVLSLVFALLLSLFGCAPTPTKPTPTPTEPVVENSFGLDEKLIDVLIETIRNEYIMFDMVTLTFGDKLKELQNGGEAYHVKFSNDDFYYACVYFDVEPGHYEGQCCCTDKYTWVRFEKPWDIPEYYNGIKLFRAFQINKAEFCYNIVTESTEKTMEHYIHYNPEFEDGINTAHKLWITDELIYLEGMYRNSTIGFPSDNNLNNEIRSDDVMYYTRRSYFRYNHTLDCFTLDGKTYIKHEHYSVRNGVKSELDLRKYFGDYYDELTEIMITDKCLQFEDYPDAAVQRYFVLFSFEDIAEIIKN